MVETLSDESRAMLSGICPDSGFPSAWLRELILRSWLSIEIGINYSSARTPHCGLRLESVRKPVSVLNMISAKLDGMAPGDREIGQYIVDNPDQMLRLSTAALAGEIGRSQSSVVKFSQKLGYASYQELKLAVSEARAQD
ncbi:MurR/RpiR family transcriptional regulator, partial [Nostoc ellipsosporum NOK]|nr:MurR/RpiR family transcriptional regulator [Nostoc ellipsosporum NOK]